MLQTNSIINYAVGDFVRFQYGKKDNYPGRVVDIEKGTIYHVEICMNKKKSEQCDTEIVKGNWKQLSPISSKSASE